MQKNAPRLRVNDQLAFHVSMPESAVNAALERVGPGSMRHELHGYRRIFVKLEAVLLCCEGNAGIALGRRAVWIWLDFDAMGPVKTCDLQSHRGSLLHMDG